MLCDSKQHLFDMNSIFGMVKYLYAANEKRHSAVVFACCGNSLDTFSRFFVLLRCLGKVSVTKPFHNDHCKKKKLQKVEFVNFGFPWIVTRQIFFSCIFFELLELFAEI